MLVDKKILFLIESDSLKQQIKQGLGCLKFQLIEPLDYKKILHLLTNDQPNLILLDGEALNIGTLEFLKILRDEKIMVPSVVFSEVSNFKLKQESLRLGVFDFVDKPIAEEKLIKTISLALQWGKEFLEKSLPDSSLKVVCEGREISLGKKTLNQLDILCKKRNLSIDAYIEKAVLKALAKDDPATSPLSFWNPQVITGVTWIDDQHYLLLLQIQEIYSMYFEHHNTDKLSEVFAFLYMYIENHFSQEEQFFHFLDEHERIEHLKQHTHFSQKMNELRREINTDNNDKAVFELALYCQHWFVSHIRVIDQNLVFKMNQASTLN